MRTHTRTHTQYGHLKCPGTCYTHMYTQTYAYIYMHTHAHWALKMPGHVICTHVYTYIRLIYMHTHADWALKMLGHMNGTLIEAMIANGTIASEDQVMSEVCKCICTCISFCVSGYVCTYIQHIRGI
jgi:hypothetical protein